ncbi:MAG: hypothetical protein RL490_944 [Pseudomonadota bacterium]|jgi:hypothetical protein
MAASAAAPVQAPVAPVIFTAAAFFTELQASHFSWHEVKARNRDDAPRMRGLIAARMAVVDGKIMQLNAKYGDDLIAKSVGSDNLTSDYDLTLASKSGDGREIAAIREFNKDIQAAYKYPPGYVFDTNLYAKDFVDVKDKVIGDGRHDDKDIAAIAIYQQEDARNDDVGALTKQRQYMRSSEWDAYKSQVIARMADKTASGTSIDFAQKQALHRFEQAETLFITKIYDKAGPILAHLVAQYRDDRGSEAALQVQTFAKAWAAAQAEKDKAGANAHLAAIETLATDIIAFASHHHAPIVLEVTNDVYLTRMARARALQNQHRALDNKQDRTETDRFQSDALKARAKQEITEANFFAAEAYLSEGALRHIVKGSQGKDSAALAQLTAMQLLSSMNEQFGDVLKDLGHYGKNAGQALYQTSKYIWRFFDALERIMKGRTATGFPLLQSVAARIPATLASLNAGLVAIRAPSGIYAAMTDEQRAEAALPLAMTAYGTKDIDQLRALLQGIVIEANAMVRTDPAAPDSASARKDRDDEKSPAKTIAASAQQSSASAPAAHPSASEADYIRLAFTDAELRPDHHRRQQAIARAAPPPVKPAAAKSF